MYNKFHRVNFIHVGSYTDSSDWIKKKKATINWKNIDDKCFRCAATVVLNYEIESHPERVLNIKQFTNKYKWMVGWLEKMV